MTTKKSREELNQEYGRRLVDQSLSLWSALNKAVEKDSLFLNLVMRAKSPSEAWESLKSMVESDDITTDRENAKKNFELLAMIVE